MSGEIIARAEFARLIAPQAGVIALRHFRKPDLPVEQKRDGTPVTVADQEAEQFLRERVERRFPHDAILGEELGERAGTSNFRWVFDPIDGTKSFICGVPLFGTLVGVEERRKDGTWHPVIGVIHMPALEETVWASEGHGAWSSVRGSLPHRVRVSEIDRLDESVYVTTGREYFERASASHLHERLAVGTHLTRGWSDCYGALLVATGRAEVWCEPVVSVWDVAAVYPIILEAGGKCSDWSGAINPRAGNCLASNGHVHRAALALLASKEPLTPARSAT
jgi:histidinol phosphatase-like enzyme (inositol monophosphatase family)